MEGQKTMEHFGELRLSIEMEIGNKTNSTKNFQFSFKLILVSNETLHFTKFIRMLAGQIKNIEENPILCCFEGNKSLSNLKTVDH